MVDTDEEYGSQVVGQQEITESNMLVYMGLVEQRINEILQVYVYVQNKRQKPLFHEREEPAGKARKEEADYN